MEDGGRDDRCGAEHANDSMFLGIYGRRPRNIEVLSGGVGLAIGPHSGPLPEGEGGTTTRSLTGASGWCKESAICGIHGRRSRNIDVWE